MTFTERFRWNVRLLHDDLQRRRTLIPVCMWENGPRGAFVELGSDGVLLVSSDGRAAQFHGDAEQQAEQAIKEFGWE